MADPGDKNTMQFSDKEKADTLQKQFCSVFTHEPPGETPTLPSRTAATVSVLEVSESMVFEELMNLDVNKASLPDDINPRMLKELASFISKPIAAILNKSFHAESIPSDWRRANVCAIFKKG